MALIELLDKYVMSRACRRTPLQVIALAKLMDECVMLRAHGNAPHRHQAKGILAAVSSVFWASDSSLAQVWLLWTAGTGIIASLSFQ